MSTIWDAFVPKAKEVVPANNGWLLNPALLLSCGSWTAAAYLCLTIACYLTVFRLVRWNRAARHRLEESLDRLVTMKQFSELTDQHQRVRTQMNHQVHMYGLLDEEVDRLRDDAKTLLNTVVSAERALLPERLRLRDLQYEQQQQQERQQRQQKQPGGAPQQQAQQQPQPQPQQQQVRRRRPAPTQRPRQHQRPHATTSVPATASLPAAATSHKEPATATAPAPATSSTAAAACDAGATITA